MQRQLGRHWFHMTPEEVARLLDVEVDKGLDLFEVKHRTERFGANRLTPKRKQSAFTRFLLQFHNPLIYILLAAAVITATVKREGVDAAIILAVVLINAVISYLQEAKAEKAIEALIQSMDAEATVLRAGRTLGVSAVELIPGDIVLLKAGDRVPADMRLVRSKDLQVAEAALTGESVPVEKNAEAILAPETPIADRRNMAFTSTLITHGQGTGIVTATGDDTEIGRISELIGSAREIATPLTRKIAAFSHLILYAVVALAAATFGVGLLRGQSAIETFTAAVALAVAAIPEGLPAALTVTLAIGVSRMARRRAIIRKLPAVETLGSVTDICSDKTGTLTKNEMTVKAIAVAGEDYTVSGTGYDPVGAIQKLDAPAALPEHGAARETLRAGVLCNDSTVRQVEGRVETQGDPTEIALVVSAHKAGIGAEELRAQFPRLDEVPFDSQHQYMATLHGTPDGGRVVYLKGAAEVLLERCSAALNAAGETVPLEAADALRRTEAMAGRGLRVLAFARCVPDAAVDRIDHASVSGGLAFLGLQAMIDPPRGEAVAAVATCRQAGIQVKMITGDHALTALAIGRQVGLVADTGSDDGAHPEVLTGKQLAQLSDAQVIEAVASTHVFARVSPEQKLRLVEALQSRGRVVAMTGDGVNDGPALKQADIGIAMGITGTEVAREASDMVLTDDNFATIEAAVEEGRGVFDNLTKIIAWTLPTNVGEGLIILLAILAGLELPILPVQILWINMVTVTVLGLVLAMEPKEADIMARPPRDPAAPILTRILMLRILMVGLVILVGAFGLYEWELMRGSAEAVARTVAVNVVVAVEILYLFNARSMTQSIIRQGWLSNPWAIGGTAVMIGLQLLFTYAGWMNRTFQTAPISAEAWGRILLVALAGFVLVEIEKWMRRRAGVQAEAGRGGAG